MFIFATSTIAIVAQEVSDYVDHFGRVPSIIDYVSLVQDCNEEVSEQVATDWLIANKQIIINESMMVC